MTVDVIIPVYKPDKTLFDLLAALETQTVPAQSIILMNTGEAYFEAFLQANPGKSLPEKVKVYHVTEAEYDHGATRHQATTYCASDFFLCMTQDAVPADNRLIETLLEGFQTEGVAVSYGRQLATEKSGTFEKIARVFNYPEISSVKSKEDLQVLGIKTYFCSNVCALYRRSVYNELGGFCRKTIFNEDMIFAAGVIAAGYKIAYQAKACVYHAHNYTNRQQFRRNFDLAVSQADHPEVFAGVKSESEGKKLVAFARAELKKQKKARLLPHFYMQCAAKYAGFLLGKRYRILPKAMVRKISMNKAYWK